MFVLKETHVKGPKIVHLHVWVETSGYDSTYDPQGELNEDPNIGAQHYKAVAIADPNDSQSTRQRPIDGYRRWNNLYFNLKSCRCNPRDPNDGAWVRSWSIGMGIDGTTCFPASLLLS